MTQEKILEYLKAELEWTMRQKPNRDCCSDDEEYNTECIAWDAECFLLNKLIDNIKHYDDEEDIKRFVDNFINGIRWTD